MLKKIAISQVQTGMFIHAVDGPWLNHSLWKTKFLIKDEEMLTRVRGSGGAECWIDVSQGDDVRAQCAAAATPATPAATAAKPAARKSMADELQNAANVLKRSKSA